MFNIMRIPPSQELRIAVPSTTRVELLGLCWRAGSVPDWPRIVIRVVMTPAGKGGESQAKADKVLTRSYSCLDSNPRAIGMWWAA
jgi:hypothetical protein